MPVVVAALAGPADIAVDNARLYAQTRRRQRWLEATGEVNDDGANDDRQDRRASFTEAMLAESSCGHWHAVTA